MSRCLMPSCQQRSYNNKDARVFGDPTNGRSATSWKLLGHTARMGAHCRDRKSADGIHECHKEHGTSSCDGTSSTRTTTNNENNKIRNRQHVLHRGFACIVGCSTTRSAAPRDTRYGHCVVGVWTGSSGQGEEMFTFRAEQGINLTNKKPLCFGQLINSIWLF